QEQTKKSVQCINNDLIINASYYETDGFLDDVYHVCQSLVDAAKRKGAKFINDEVEKIVEEKGKVKGVLCKKGGEISADFVVNAGGLGANDISQTVGIDLPIEFEKRRILYTNRVKERIHEHLLVPYEKGFAAKQLT